MPAGAAATLLGGWLVRRLRLTRHQLLAACCALQLANIPLVGSSASKSSIRRFVITEKAPTRAFSFHI